MHGRAPGRPSRRPCARPRLRSFRLSSPSPPPFPCLRWLEGTPLPSPFGSFSFQQAHLEDALLALLDELTDPLAALPAGFRDRHAALSVAAGLDHGVPFPAAIPAPALESLLRPAPASCP